MKLIFKDHLIPSNIQIDKHKYVYRSPQALVKHLENVPYLENREISDAFDIILLKLPVEVELIPPQQLIKL